MRHSIVVAILIIMASTTVAQDPDCNLAEAWVLDVYNESEEEVNITFTTGGGDNLTAYFTLLDEVPIEGAVLGVKGLSDEKGRYPKDIMIDVGNDGDYEWKFEGVGYGNLGNQTLFNSDEKARHIAFLNDLVNETSKIRLPKGAVVTKASMNITGKSGGNLGVMIKREDNVVCQIRCYSSTSNPQPRLVINYSDGNSTILQPLEAQANDTMISSENPSTNFGSNYQLLTSSNYENRALIQFDLSLVDINKEVISAVMEINTFSYSAGQNWTIHEVLEPWNEMSVNWNTRPEFNPTVEDFLLVDWANSIQWARWNITDLVNMWLKYAPENITIDVGGDGILEYEMQGILDYTDTTLDFTDKLNQYLATASTSYEDDFGNKFIDIPFVATSDTMGRIVLTNLCIEYDWTTTINKNPQTGNLKTEIKQHMKLIPAEAGYIKIPILVHSGTAGIVKLVNLNLTFNGPPILATEIPSNLSLDEDTAVKHFLDLSHFFIDDYRSSTNLAYSIVGNTRSDRVYLSVIDDYWLKVDSAEGNANDNFNGEFTVIVRATDELGFFTDSNPFIINVTPVNDEPIKGSEAIPDISIVENGISDPIELDNGRYFVDIDGDDLFFIAIVDPWDLFDDEQLYASINGSTKDLTIRATGDYFGEDIPLRVYCDDDYSVDDNLYWDLMVEVVNLNDDPPLWSEIPPVHVQEDGIVEDVFNVLDYIDDVDNNDDSLTYSIILNSNETKVTVSIDTTGSVDISAIGENWTGQSMITISAVDDGGNRADTDFVVIIDPVNDLPIVHLLSPLSGSDETSDEVLLHWEGIDAETVSENLTYSIHITDGSIEKTVAEGISGSMYSIKVTDGRTYYWTVSASDDGGNYGPITKRRLFNVDFAAGPRTYLVSPRDGIILTDTNKVVLEWSVEPRPGSKDNVMSYDIYLGEDRESLGIIAYGILGTRWNLTDIIDNTKYYWKVVPADSIGTGTCKNGIWGFSIDSSFDGYNIELEVLPEQISVEPGETGVFSVRVTNSGAAPDIIQLVAEMSDVPGLEIFYDGNKSRESSLIEGAYETVIISLEIPGSTIPGTYVLKVTAMSLFGEINEMTEVKVKVVSEHASDSDTGDEQGIIEGVSDSISISILIILIIIVSTVFVLLITQNRKKNKRISELEAIQRTRKASILESEVSILPTPLLSGATETGNVILQLPAGNEENETTVGDRPTADPVPYPKPLINTSIDDIKLENQGGEEKEQYDGGKTPKVIQEETTKNGMEANVLFPDPIEKTTPIDNLNY